ncbi:MAG: hypothetical protein FWH01_05670 [Oscillospiraceae bacterium]|nr:hypothetical protein [Oscillospiraceae bacterium]
MMDDKITDDNSYVRYEDFGAAGDGRTDDFHAIQKAHAYANERCLTVKANPAKTYYIGFSPEPAVIMTDTDWGGARFIVDDTCVPAEQRGVDVFEVKSRMTPFEMEAPAGIRKGQRRIYMGAEAGGGDGSDNGERGNTAKLKQNALVIATNSGKKQFMRKGLNVNSGFDQIDCFILDESGNILTPVIWDFDNVTSLTAYPIDERALLLTGGEFTTVSTKYSQDKGYNYFSRGISFSRSNVIVTGLVHHVAGELEDTGSPYAGFVRTRACAYIQFRDCHFFGHKFYSTIGAAGLPVSMGTYDINLQTSIGVAFYNCRQDNIMDASRWGVIGSNGCKDLLLDGCVFSRVDAHMNVANLTVRNTTLGVQGFNAIGHGLLTVENVTIMGPSVVSLRGDYGSSWDGDLYIKNVTWYPAERVSGNPAVITANNSGDHDFGYPCSFPRKVVIEGLRVMDGQYSGLRVGTQSGVQSGTHGEAQSGQHECVSIFGGIDESNTGLKSFGAPAEGDFPHIFSELLVAEGLSTETGKGFRLWSGDVDRCYSAKPYAVGAASDVSNTGKASSSVTAGTADAGGLWPNFRARLTDIDRFVYDMSASEIAFNGEHASKLAGEHSLAPDIRVSECPRVAIRAGNRTARLMISDCALEDGADMGGKECEVVCERVKGVLL